jgi:hypothetical protein
MCTISKCRNKAVAKGLCAKHYMRARRAGDPTKVRKPGRPRARLTQLMAGTNWSPRTLARFRRASRLLLKFTDKSAKRLMAEATRSNGSVNVSKLLKICDLLDRHLERFPHTMVPCVQCGQKFLPERSDAKTCSPACRQARYRARRKAA